MDAVLDTVPTITDAPAADLPAPVEPEPEAAPAEPAEPPAETPAESTPESADDIPF